jgi:hypothetical protein
MQTSSWGIQPPIHQPCTYTHTPLGKLNASFTKVNRSASNIQNSTNVLGYAERAEPIFNEPLSKLQSQNLREKVIISFNPNNKQEIRLTRIYWHEHPNQTRYRQLGEHLTDHLHQEGTSLHFQEALTDNQMELIRSTLQQLDNGALFQLVEKDRRMQTPAERFMSLLNNGNKTNLGLLHSQYTAINAFPQSNNTALLEGVQLLHDDQFQLTGTNHIAITKHPNENLLYQFQV